MIVLWLRSSIFRPLTSESCSVESCFGSGELQVQVSHHQAYRASQHKVEPKVNEQATKQRRKYERLALRKDGWTVSNFSFLSQRNELRVKQKDLIERPLIITDFFDLTPSWAER